jgi:hypothetical protein
MYYILRTDWVQQRNSDSAITPIPNNRIKLHANDDDINCFIRTLLPESTYGSPLQLLSCTLYRIPAVSTLRQAYINN